MIDELKNIALVLFAALCVAVYVALIGVPPFVLLATALEMLP